MMFFDTNIIIFLNSIAWTNSFTYILTIIFARPLHIVILILAIYFLLFINSKNEERQNPLREFILKIKKNLFVVIAVFVALVISIILKDLFLVPRPFETIEALRPLFLYGTMDSFPSGHATVYSALATSIFIYNKKVGLFFGFGALLIGLGRIASGVHYTSDVLAGYSIGIIVPILLFYFIKPKIGRFF
jgi:undecaprenyl-diphosphatase